MKTKPTKYNQFLPYFLLICAADLFAMNQFEGYRYITKPLILLSLIGYFLYSTQTVRHKVRWIFLAALVFAFAGDCFLIGEGYFILGLGSFLIMQILYTVSFLEGDNYHGWRGRVGRLQKESTI